MGARGKNFYTSLFQRYGDEAEVKLIQDLYLDGKLMLDEMVSHRIKLEQINDGYDLMRNRQTTRTVITFD